MKWTSFFKIKFVGPLSYLIRKGVFNIILIFHLLILINIFIPRPGNVHGLVTFSFTNYVLFIVTMPGILWVKSMIAELSSLL